MHSREESGGSDPAGTGRKMAPVMMMMMMIMMMRILETDMLANKGALSLMPSHSLRNLLGVMRSVETVYND